MSKSSDFNLTWGWLYNVKKSNSFDTIAFGKILGFQIRAVQDFA